MVKAASGKPKKRARAAGANGGKSDRRGQGRSAPAGGSEDASDAGRGRVDQLGAIFTKGLDLAEASLSLGLTVLNRVGMAAQEQVLDKMMPRSPAADGAMGPDGPPPGMPVEASGFGAGAPEIPVAEEPSYGITNRRPLAPGNPVKVSFSLNNDSMTASKTVTLRIEGFAGEVEGAQLDASRFGVKPPRKTIAPMDFEKFVLEGVVSPDVPSDVYHGSIVVSAGPEFRIPVRLVVLAT